jgi:hypothetical protein
MVLTTGFLAQKSRKISVVFSGWFWHIFQGCSYLRCNSWHRFRGSRIARKRHRKRGADLYMCERNSHTNFEEFGSIFCVKTWHGFQDKFVIKFMKMNML